MLTANTACYLLGFPYLLVERQGPGEYPFVHKCHSSSTDKHLHGQVSMMGVFQVKQAGANSCPKVVC